MSFRTPLSRVLGLGSARSGTEHWWLQRLTSIAAIPLTLFLLWLAFHLAGADYQTARATLHQPLVAVLLALSVITILWHMHLGMQVIIEDYVHSKGWRLACLIGNLFLPILLGAMTLYALLSLSFGA